MMNLTCHLEGHAVVGSLTHHLLELFAKNTFFGHFGDFQSGYDTN